MALRGKAVTVILEFSDGGAELSEIVLELLRRYIERCLDGERGL